MATLTNGFTGKVNGHSPDQEQLESLREQYEEQLASLKRELEEERTRRPLQDAAAQDSDSDEAEEGDSHKMSPSKKEKFQSNFLRRLGDLQDRLDTTEKDLLLKLQPEIEKAYNEDIGDLETFREAELRLQVEAMKFTVSQVHSTQLKLVKTELLSQHEEALESQRKQLTDEYHEALEVLQKEFEELEAKTDLTPEEMEYRVRTELQEAFDNEIEELRSKLEAEHEVEMEEYRAKLNEEKDEFQRSIETKYEVDMQLLKSKIEAEQEVELEEIRASFERQVTQTSHISEQTMEDLKEKLMEISNLEATVSSLKEAKKESLSSVTENVEISYVDSAEASPEGTSPPQNRSPIVSSPRGAKSSTDSFRHSAMLTRVSFDDDDVGSGAGTSTQGNDAELIQELQLEIEAYKAQLDAYRSETEEVHRVEIESLKEQLHHQYTQEIEDLKLKHIKELENQDIKLREELARSPPSTESDNVFFADTEDVKMQLENLSSEVEQYKRELSSKEDEIKMVKKEMADKHQVHIEKLMADMSERHQAEYRRLSTGSDASGRDSADSSLLEERLREQSRTHRHALEQQQLDMEEKYHQDLEDLRSELQSKHFEEMENLKNDQERKYDHKSAQLKHDYEEMLRGKEEAMSARIEREVSLVKDEMDTLIVQEREAAADATRGEMEEQVDAMLKEMEQIQRDREELEGQISELEDAHREKIASMEAELRKEYEEKVSEKEATVTSEEVEKFEMEKAEFDKKQKKFAREQKDMNDKVAECEEKLRLQDEEIEEYKQSIEEYKGEFENLNKMIQDANLEKHSLDNQLVTYRTQVKAYEEQIKIYKQKMNSDSEETVDDEEKQELYQKIEGYNKLIADLETQLDEKNDAIHEFEIDVEELRSQLEEAEQHMEYIKLQNTELEEQVDDTRASLEERDSMIRDYEERVREYDTNLGSVNSDHDHRLRQLEDKYKKDTEFFEGKIAELREKLSQVERERSGSESGDDDDDEVKDLKNEVANLTQQITDLENKFEQYKIDVSEGVAEEVTGLKERLISEHEEEMDQMQSALKVQQEAVLQAVQKEFQAKQAQLIEEYTSTMDSGAIVADLKDIHQKELRDLRGSLEEEHEKELTSLTESHTAEMEQLRQELNSSERDTSGESGLAEAEWSEGEREEQQRGWEANREAEKEDLAKLEDELTDLKAHQLEQLENVKVKIKEDLLKENMANFEQMTIEMETSHRSEIETLKKKYEEQIATLEAQVESIKDSGFRETKESVIVSAETVEVTAPKPTSGLDEEFSVASSQEFDGRSSQELGSTLQSTLTPGEANSFQLELEALHQSSLEEMSLQHNREIQTLTDDYEAQLEELNKQLVDVRKSLQRQYEESLSKELQQQRDDLTQEHEKHIQELEEQKTEAIDKLMQQMDDYETEISSLKEKISESLEDSEAEKEDSQSEVQQEIKKLKAVIKEKEQEIVNMKQDFNEVRENDLAELRYELEQEKEDALEELRTEYSKTIDDMEKFKNELQQSLGEEVSGDDPNADSVPSLNESVASLPESYRSEGSQGTLTYQDSEEEVGEDQAEKVDSTPEKGQDLEGELASLRREIARLTEELEGSVPRAELDSLRAVLEDRHREEVEEMKQRWLDEKDEEILKVQSECEANLAKRMEEFGAEMEEEKESELLHQKERFQAEITALRQSLEDMSTESEKHAQSTDDMMKLKEIHFEEISAKENIIEKLSNEIRNMQEDASKYKAQISDLEDRLSGQKDDYELIIGRRDREHEEGDNLMAMLRSELDRLQAERDATNSTNDHLLKILSDNVKNNLHSEDKINKCLAGLIAEGRRVSTPTLGLDGAGGDEEGGAGARASPALGGARGDAGEDETALQDLSALSLFSDEGLDLSQRISESIFVGPELDPDGEEIVAEAGHRLQNAVERLLDMMTDTTHQLHEAQSTQKELIAKLSQRTEEADNLSMRCADLSERLNDEAETRQFLTVELNKSESLVEGYSEEKAKHEGTIQNLEDNKEMLVEEVERLRIRLAEYEDQEMNISAREQDLERQMSALEQSIGREEQVVPPGQSVTTDPAVDSPTPPSPEGQGLLQENNRLAEEKRELQRHYSKDQEETEARLEELQATVEELQAEIDNIQDERKMEADDFLRQIENLDKQLRSNKQFLEEQTIEREEERFEYQREQQKLQTALKEKEKHENQESRLMREVVAFGSSSVTEGDSGDDAPEVADLEEQLQYRIDMYNETLIKKEQTERDLQSQELTSRELRDMMKQLETDLDSKTARDAELSDKVVKLQTELARVQESNIDLSQELKKRDSYGNAEEMQRVINDLESQVDTLKNSEQQEVQRRKEVEEELKNLKTLEEELTADKEALQQQVCNQMKELSTLKSQVDELKLGKADTGAAEHVSELREKLESEREALHLKDKEICDLTEQLEQIRDNLMDREDEVQQMTAQIDVVTQETENEVMELKVQNKNLDEENKKLKAEIAQLKDAVDSTPMPVLAQTLIDEKNAEIDHLNAEIDNLKQGDGANNENQQLMEQLRSEVESRESELQAAQAEVESRNSELQAALSEVEDLKQLVSSMRETESLAQEEAETRHRQDAMGGSDRAQLLAALLQLESLRDQLQQKDFDIVRAQEELDNQHKEKLRALNDVLNEKEGVIEQLTQQVESSQNEVESITEYNTRLQDDFDMVQTMLESKQKEIESLSKELEEVRPQTEGITADMQAKYEDEINHLQREVTEKQNVIEEKEEELYTMAEKLEKQEEIEQELEGAKETIERQKSEIRALTSRSSPADVTDGSDLANQIREQEVVIMQLRHEMKESSQKMKSQQDELNQALSELSSLEQKLRSQEEYHQQEIEALKLNNISRSSPQIEEMKVQLAGEKQRAVDEVRRQLQKRHTDEINRLILDHQRELQTRTLELTGQDESIVADTQRLKLNVDQNERLDSSLFGRLGGQHRLSTESSGGFGSLSSMGDDEETNKRLEAILRKVHDEGVRVLSLSELQFLRGLGSLHTDVGHLQQAWQEEKHSLLSAVQALKDLLAETQKTHDISKKDDSNLDWRADILRAVHNVFGKEKEGLLSEMHSFRVSNTQALPPTFDKLEEKARQQESEHQAGMQQMYSADRQSMLAEIRELRRQISSVRTDHQADLSRLAEQGAVLEDQFSNKERQLRRQIELLEYKINQEKVVSDDLRSSLEVEKSRTIELSGQLSREKNNTSELQNDISDTQSQLQKLENALEREQTRLVSASILLEDMLSALDEERKKSVRLNEALAQEHANSEQYIEQLEAEQFRNIQYKDKTSEMLEKMKQDLEIEKERRIEATSALEREKITISSVNRELELEKEQHRATQAKNKLKQSELKTQLEAEKSHNAELNSALQRERQLCSQLRDSLDDERGSVHDTSLREKMTISDLQSMLDLERSKILDMQAALERERHKVAALNNKFDNENSQISEDLEREKAVTRQLRNNIDALQMQKGELARELEFAGDKVTKLQDERERLQTALITTKGQLRDLEGQQEVQRVAEKQLHRELEREKLDEQHEQLKHTSEIQRLNQRIADLELQLAEVRRSEVQAREERDLERLKNAMSPARNISRYSQREDNLEQGTRRPAPRGNVLKKQIESLRQKLQLLVIKHQEELARCSHIENGRLSIESNPTLQSISKALKDIMTELQQIQALVNGDSSGDDTGAASSVVPALNEKILAHNSELTSFISQLSEEKHELRRALTNLEEEIWNYRQKESTYAQAGEAEDKLATERHRWSQERASFSMQINQSEKENLELKQALRRTEIELEREREKYFVNSHETQAAVDKEKMQRLYGKYLRAESFRKALIYQKKYLLLLLGGFQDCEEETLAMIAKLGAYPSSRDMHRRPSSHSQPYSRFRSAVRVVIAISRLRFLVKKWKRATRVGTPVIAGNVASQSGARYVPSSNGFSSPHRVPYPSGLASASQPVLSQPSTLRGGLDSYSSASSRGSGYSRAITMGTPPTREAWPGRDGKENRQPAVNIGVHKSPASRRQILSALEPMQEPPPTPPSSLIGRGDTPTPSDPAVDDSLNDYIHRLETLQARLGSVTQGARNHTSHIRR